MVHWWLLLNFVHNEDARNSLVYKYNITPPTHPGNQITLLQTKLSLDCFHNQLQSVSFLQQLLSLNGRKLEIKSRQGFTCCGFSFSFIKCLASFCIATVYILLFGLQANLGRQSTYISSWYMHTSTLQICLCTKVNLWERPPTTGTQETHLWIQWWKMFWKWVSQFCKLQIVCQAQTPESHSLEVMHYY
jgi:hypothetical protein